MLRAELRRRGARDAARARARAATRWRCWSPTSACPAWRAPSTSSRRARSCPDAKRVLLTAYADTEAAIAAINEVALDYYLLKPWDPPEEQLYPVVEDLLTTWEAGAALRVRRRARDRPPLLARDPRPARLPGPQPRAGALAGRRARRRGARAADASPAWTPTGCRSRCSRTARVLERPTVLELAERLGVAGQPAAEHYDLVIVGGGPAGLGGGGLRRVGGPADGAWSSARRPAARPGSRSRIENYLGFPAGLSGSDLARRATDQARRLGAELLTRAGRRRPAGRGRRAHRRALRRRDAERQLRARRLRRLLPPARRAGLRRAHRRRDLLRRGDDRGARRAPTSTSSSSAAPTPPARPPSTSPATRRG